VLKDDKQAVYWYQKAADQGQAQTQFNLGVKYAFGKGVLKDDKQAVY
jgi:TPR repeat protein